MSDQIPFPFLPGIILVLGGTRSGKSSFAQNLAKISGRQKVYLATGYSLDDEMANRIALHQVHRGPDWQLVEERLDLPTIISQMANKEHCIVVDCLTFWLTNLVMAGKNVIESCQLLLDYLLVLSAEFSVILVSNEVGQGIVPETKMARDFRDHAGQLNQDIAAIANHVWFLTAGLPQKLK
ncbi:bifunctional adenosylcobinamide kinase/adenosylcobinamide-phosphate guanylyltransferase [Candidatus Endowatersipora endosymbiont of Watersipora subatra]|uniref:bifunctional adenosylcobinamide kinase/adenosylcobinamide-phosphate guanylyltransferase n=1 Tax=Candidatus Endowatersipora endosymbiont of Watersipora subatra TaxID=3077946 RepID=UPI00312CB6A5